jgi:Flagellar biosynthesis protein, FliO.
VNEDEMKSNKQGGRSANVSVALRQQGLISRFFQTWVARRAAGSGHVRKMQLLETLSLGGKRQLMLVQCGAEQFLVGGSLETVETIVKVDGVADVSLQVQGDVCR